MKKFALILAAQAAIVLPAHAASITNKDAEARVIVVTESGAKSEMSVAAGETASICASGCFLTMPNGDRIPLKGDEKVEIVGGKAVLR